ncbi:MAG: hypothetical protein Q8O64_20110 [Sideroxyarcus sp.]|nr:hypothetical protein [Sideroxyarcus sp.]
MDKPTTKEYKVVIFDDETERACEWKQALLAMGMGDLVAHVPEQKEIQEALTQLHARRTAADSSTSPYEIECSLDSVDVLVVDYDLRLLEEHRGFATGEEIAYAARLFSKVKIIVVVNHPDIGLNDFDLTLQRDRNLKGDVYVGHEQIANPGLWRCNPGHNGFVPWCWPVLLEDAEHFDQCVAEVSAHWTDNILSYFGLDIDETRPSPEMLAFLGMPRGGMTFEQIFSDPLDKRTRPFVRPKDLPPLLNDQDRQSRVLTALLKKWLRRWVMPAQTVLADAPHIAVAFPWGLEDYQSEAQWKEIHSKGRCNAMNLNGIFKAEIIAHSFKLPEWVGRPAFYSQKVSIALEGAGLPLNSFEFGKLPKLLFAEDLSRFIPTDEAFEYDLTLDGQAQVRAVRKPDCTTILDTPFDPKSVVYVPQSLMT